MENNVTFAEIFGLRIAVGTKSELLELCASRIGLGGAIYTVNPEILASSLVNEELYEALSEGLCIPDGIGVERALRSLGHKAQRMPGVELGELLLDRIPIRLAIVGGNEGVAERAIENLTGKYRDIIPAFALEGYNVTEEDILDCCEYDMPDVMFVSMGAPKQEVFIRRLRRRMPNVLFIALGGSVDIYAMDKKRAPRAFRMLGLEWLYRMMAEPWRLSRLPRLLTFVREFNKEKRSGTKIGKKSPKSL
jgi:N-acetylglucosaminyldiphosphoundecaprenol N-acetyl-beta-D-mannosaminyltransferase